MKRNTRRVEMNATYFKPILYGVTGFGIGRGGTAFGAHSSFPLQFTLGGGLRLGAYGVDELRGDKYLYGALGALKKIAQLPAPIGGAMQFGIWAESGGVGLGNGALSLKHGLSAAVVADTLLGPLLFGVAVGQSGHKNLFFGIGRFF